MLAILPRLALLTVLGGLLLGGVPGAAQAAPSSWARVKAVPRGTSVEVILGTMETVQGRLRQAGDDAMVVTLPEGDRTLSRTDVVRVSEARRSRRLRHAYIGSAIGAGGGAATGAVGCRKTPPPPCLATGLGRVACGLNFNPGSLVCASVLGGLGAVVGAVVGALLPASGWHEIYRVAAPAHR